MVRVYSLLQTVVLGVLFIGTLMPYVQYLMFSQALTTDLERKVAQLTRERDEERRKLRHIEEDAHAAEERAAALDKHAGEHENQHRALEHLVQKLQKKLDVCTNDRGVLSGELGSATRKAAGASHLEVLVRQCEADKQDAVALQTELKRELAQMEEELDEAREAREKAELREAQHRALEARIKVALEEAREARASAERREAQQRTLATRFQEALIAVRKEESMAGKVMASALSTATLTEIGEVEGKRKNGAAKRKGRGGRVRKEKWENEEEEEDYEQTVEEDEEGEGDGDIGPRAKVRQRAKRASKGSQQRSGLDGDDDEDGEGIQKRKRDVFGRLLPEDTPNPGFIKARKERSNGSSAGGRPGRAGPGGNNDAPTPVKRNMTRLEKVAARAERRRSHPEEDDYDYKDPPDDNTNDANKKGASSESSGDTDEGGSRKRPVGGRGGKVRNRRDKQRGGDDDDKDGEGEDTGGKGGKDGNEGGSESGRVRRTQDRDLIHRLDTNKVKALPLQTRLLSTRSQQPNAGNIGHIVGEGTGSSEAANAALARAARAGRDREKKS